MIGKWGRLLLQKKHKAQKPEMTFPSPSFELLFIPHSFFEAQLSNVTSASTEAQPFTALCFPGPLDTSLLDLV